MKIAAQLFILVFLLTACSRREKQANDSQLRQRLTGAWTVEVLSPDGSASSKGTWIVAADNSFRSEFATSVSNETRTTTLEGVIQVMDGFLIETTTNAVPHWIPEGKRGTLPPGGAVSRIKIVRLDDRELVIETNEFGIVRYTKVTK